MKIELAALGLPALLVASGCGGDGPTDPGSPEPVGSVAVSPPQHQMGVGESHPFTVTLRSASGRVLTGRGVTWASGGETQRIAFSHSESGIGHIYTMASDGTDVRQLTTPTDAYDDEPAWSPDGSVIAFVRFGPGSGSDLWLVPPVGGERVLLHLGGTQFAPAWSPDGRLVAFVSRHDGQAVFDVYTVWADGTRVARRTADDVEARNPAWIVR